MKITKQISENEFVINLGEEPVNGNNTRIVVAHDYVNFFKSGTIYAEIDSSIPSFYGKHTMCSNVINVPISCQINIAEFGGMILPMLNARKEMEFEHYKGYVYPKNTVTFYNENRKKMISFFNEDGTVETISVELYQRIKARKD
jgi:hypothetical protein